MRRRGDAIIGRQLARLVADGNVRLLTSRVRGGQGRTLTLEDGTRLTPSTVLWCTGFRPDYPWLHVPGALDDDDAPRHQAGASPVPGLEWMGLPWQTRLNSSIANGIDRDAEDLVRRLQSHGLTAGLAAPTPGGVG